MKRFLLTTLLAGASLAGPFLNAQDGVDSAEPTVELDPFVVTGEKIARPLTETLTSVGFVSGELLQSADTRDLNDSFRFLANVRDADWIDAGIVIRGINSEGIGGPIGSPMATLYVDGVPQTNNAARRGALGMWDVAQVEVLRGPQSTLIGRNALAGAVIVETRNPTFEPEYALLAGAGNQGSYEGALMASGPLTEKLAFRIAGEFDHSDGEIGYPNYRGLPNLDQRQHADYRHLRGKLLYLPGGEDGTRLLLNASHTYNSPAYADVDGSSAGLDFFEDRQWGNQTSPLFDEARATETSQFGLQVEVPLEGDWDLQSLSGFTRTLTDRSSVDAATTGGIDENEYTQEIRATYSDGRLDAVTGAFFLFGESANNRRQQRPWEAFLRHDTSETETRNAAIFGEARWRFNEAWSLVGGLRFDHEETDFDSLNERVDASGTVTSSSASSTSADFDAWLPKAGLIAHLPDGSNLSLTVQRAYRAGGSAINNVTSSEYTFDPENAWNYEVSWKGTAMENRLIFAVNVFYLDWTDQQINVPQVPGDFTSDIILNAGESRVWGGEIELNARPREGLQLFASLGVAKTEFEDFRFVQFGSELDLSGKAFPQAPDFTAVLGGDYALGSGFSVGADASYTSETLSRSILEGLPEDTLPSYLVANARLRWERGGWSVLVYVDNVTDEEYFLYRYNDPGFQLATIGRGRTYGASVQYRY